MTCFVSNTMITTAEGEMPIEKLRVGDLVLTRDNGYQPIRRICCKRLTGRQLLDNPHLRPVLIQADAFDQAMPARDLKVAPNTRLPIEGENAGFLGRATEDLVAVKNMVNHNDIQQIDSIGTDYFLVMLDGHQTIAANGVWVENFNAKDMSLGNQGNAQRVEILEILPELKVNRQSRNLPVALVPHVRTMLLRSVGR